MKMANRRDVLKQIAVLGIGATVQAWKFKPTDMIMKRNIPKGNEQIACVGLGTWQTFDVGTGDTERAPLREVLRTLVNGGASVIDSSPMYGESEEVVGDLSTETGVNSKLFIATKVWTSGLEAGITQMETSFKLLRRKQIDLMQVHNLVDWKTHLKTLQAWKEKEKIRYIGLTHYTDSAHATLENIIKSYPIDFIQVNYSLRSRNAEKSLLPVARDKGVAVLINRPFEEGALFSRVKNMELPPWAKDFDCSSWAQFFLKFILSNSAVTCVIPGTSKAKHLLDNLKAGMGKLPNESQRLRMVKLLEA